tara:strand:- start:6924 stop:8063 length:1140 start_codon:yes stop_codon:yes gene_type:complete
LQAATHFDHLIILHEINKEEMGAYRKAFYLQSLQHLSDELVKLKQKIYFVHDIAESLNKIPKPKQVIASRSYNAWELKKEKLIEPPIKFFDQNTLYQEKELPFTIQKLPDTFSAFRRKIELQDKFSADPIKIDILPPESEHRLVSLPLPKIEQSNPNFLGGEKAGLARLQHYLWDTNKVDHYKETRNGMLEFDDSSKFSPWLALGCLSPNTIYRELKAYEEQVCKNESTYWLYFELLWRDYFKYLSLKYKEKLFEPGGIQNKNLSNIKEDSCLLEKIQSAKSGDDFIDANIKELLATGWMSNRGRQNVASFFCKELLLDWRLGANFFQKHLIDYDCESNWGNWAYLAGVGTDPRDRKFNTKKQAEIYDPDAAYRKKFLS